MSRLALALALVAVAGCSPHRLEHQQPTPDALAREVLKALSGRDASRLRALAISEREFEERVWPALPAARPERNMPWSYVWLDLRQKSDARLAETMAEFGGRRYRLDRVRFAGKTTDYGSYRVHRETVLVVRDDLDASVELRILGSLIETPDGWKVFSYVADS